MIQYKYLSMEYGSIRCKFCNIHKSSGTLPATRMHYHDFYQIYFITKGKLLHRSAEDQLLLHSGDCFIIPPHFLHSIGKVQESPEFYAFSFRPDFLDVAVLSLLPQLQTPETLSLGLSLSGGEIHVLEQLLECCLREFEQQSFGWETAVKGMLQAILVLFSRAYSDTHPVFACQSAITECVQYVDTHFREDIRLDKLLSRYHFSVSGFYRAFREVTGKSFRQYLTQKRLEHVCFLLRSTNLPLQAIAEQCGYADYSAFYRAFRKHVGLSPAQYPRTQKREISADTNKKNGP